MFGDPTQVLFVGGVLILISIFAGLISSRAGAPLLLVFLLIGMVMGEDGPGGIAFANYEAAYLIGSAALAIVLFDGGMRTHLDTLKLAAGPSLSLATIGVIVTTAVVAAATHWLAGIGWTQSVLIGSSVASTDAAAVFFLLNSRGMEIHQRVRATLEVESGLNDPIAVFLVVSCIGMLKAGAEPTIAGFALDFMAQMVGGALFGLGAGIAMVWAINRFDFAPGIYPIFAVASALAVFGGSHFVGASGFLAVYVAGLVLGNRRHRGMQLILRFHDGLAWLSQIVMFVMLGLLLTPSQMIGDLGLGFLVAAVLIVLARPLAVAICLAPFRFSWREQAFIAWVGLRGAVPIFLASLPVMNALPGGAIYFHVAFATVLASLLLQGWTIGLAGRWLRLELPADHESAERLDLDVAGDGDRDVAGYRVGAKALVMDYHYAELPLPRRVRVLSVIRDGVVMDRDTLERLEEDDYVLVVAPPHEMFELDRLFAARRVVDAEADLVFGEFTLAGTARLGEVGALYGFEVRPKDREQTVDDYIRLRLRRKVVAGDRLRVGPVELVVRDMSGGKIAHFGVELDPDEPWRVRLRRLPVAKLVSRGRNRLRWLIRPATAQRGRLDD